MGTSQQKKLKKETFVIRQFKAIYLVFMNLSFNVIRVRLCQKWAEN